MTDWMTAQASLWTISDGAPERPSLPFMQEHPPARRSRR